MSAGISANPALAPRASQAAPALKAGGLVPLSTTDYPGQLAAVVFCQGCPWQCGYCQNPHLIPPTSVTDISWESIRAFLERRQGLLDAVVFSGGEPTLQAGLEDALREARGMGFRIGLHTAGSYPERLARMLPLLDWIGLDIKAPFGKYERITGVPGSGAKARASAERVLESGIACEFRTTVHAALLGRDEVISLARELAGMGANNFVLQEFRPQGCMDAMLCAQHAGGFLDEQLAGEVGALFETFSVRRA